MNEPRGHITNVDCRTKPHPCMRMGVCLIGAKSGFSELNLFSAAFVICMEWGGGTGPGPGRNDRSGPDRSLRVSLVPFGHPQEAEL